VDQAILAVARAHTRPYLLVTGPLAGEIHIYIVIPDLSLFGFAIPEHPYAARRFEEIFAAALIADWFVWAVEFCRLRLKAAVRRRKVPLDDVVTLHGSKQSPLYAFMVEKANLDPRLSADQALQSCGRKGGIESQKPVAASSLHLFKYIHLVTRCHRAAAVGKVFAT
jgi:hypothetical protein